MGEHSAIEWCNHTFNPWIGCTKVSPGCINCYAEARDLRYEGGVHWGKGAPRRRTTAENWKLPVKWNAEVANERANEMELGPSRAGRMPTPRVFCASLADWLDDEVPIEWLADLLALIHATPHLDWLLLTKRPENWHKRLAAALYYLCWTMRPFAWVRRWLDGVAPANIWIGTTAEDQPRADERIPHLLKIPARVRFLSCEPLLGPVDLSMALEGFQPLAPDLSRNPSPVQWVICGGESGPGARPMHPDWAESLRDQCQAAGVPFFFKQWGEWASVGPHNLRSIIDTEKGRIIPQENQILMPATPDNGSRVLITRVGKKAAGRVLEGRMWDEFPSVEAPTGRER